MLNPRYSQ